MNRKRKKTAERLTALAAALILAGCSWGSDGSSPSVQNNDNGNNYNNGWFFSPTSQSTTAASSSGTAKPVTDPNKESELINKSFSMAVNKTTGQLDVSRAEEKNIAMGTDDTWTIFVYMCGSDLETGDGYYYGGSATEDINEMLYGTANDKIRFVVETGGTAQWQNSVMSNTSNEIYLVQNGEYELVNTLGDLNMGDSFTLAEFLKWGIINYPAEHMGVIFWNHGGGSIDGVCFDEIHDYDSLSLREIDSALFSVYQEMTDRFEFIGFDACLMSTVETANVIATYADYMYASQETESGYGWDYTAIQNCLASDPAIGAGELGKKVADSLYAVCEKNGEQYDATFSIIDLRKFDDFSVKFNDYCRELYENIKDGDGLNEVIRGIYSTDYFGGNSEYEGYYNMVDLGGVINAGAGKADTTAALNALSDCVYYNINGADHRGASGLSIYYPLHINGSMELSIFSDICVNPYYLSLVDLLRQGYSETGYDNDDLFDDDGYWYSGGDYGYDDYSGYYYYDNDYSDPSYEYWDYSEEDSYKDSELITFAQEPHIDEHYNYTFTLDDNGYYYTADVTAYVYEQYDNGDIIMLGETHDVRADWSTGTFTDIFDGEWLSLPDGQNLELFVDDVGDDYFTYISPIYYNGEFAYMKIRQDAYSAKIIGIFAEDSGIGAASRNGIMPEKGDIIKPYFDAFDAEGNDTEYTGYDYVYDPENELIYSGLEPQTYYYTFCITDIYGNSMTTDFQEFRVDEDGYVYYDDGSDYGYNDYDYGYDYDDYDDYWYDYDWDDDWY